MLKKNLTRTNKFKPHLNYSFAFHPKLSLISDKFFTCSFSTANSQGNERLTVTETKTCSGSGTPIDSAIPSNLSSSTSTTAGASNDHRTENESSFDLDSMHQWLDPHLRPVTPDPDNQLSKQIFDQHKDLANEYLKVKNFNKLINNFQC